VRVPVLHSDAHRAHDGLVEVLGGHEIPCFERPERISAIEAALAPIGWASFEGPEAHGADPILAVHDPALVALIEHAWQDAAASGANPHGRPLIPDTFLLAPYRDGGYGAAGTHRANRLGAFCLDTATPIVVGTYPAARAAVDVALTAADRVLAGAPLAYALCRPPGHHAAREMYGGYCFFNNAAIVAEWLLGRGAAQVAILDVDYHHGNGTQQLFWERGEVLYVSLHADPARAFPYFSGHAAERGAGDGEGATRNFPLPAGTAIDGYLEALTAACAIIDQFGPGAPLVVSLGFDTFERDPIGDLALRTEDYRSVAATIAGLRRPTIVIQEGGYAIDAIGANAVAFLDGLRGAA
jgi:acetoin utilization deacetylase AcuC-like enzyme